MFINFVNIIFYFYFRVPHFVKCVLSQNEFNNNPSSIWKRFDKTFLFAVFTLLQFYLIDYFYNIYFSECAEGYFGNNCKYTCKNCKNGGICNEDKSGCICKAGYTGLLCSYACPQVSSYYMKTHLNVVIINFNSNYNVVFSIV